MMLRGMCDMHHVAIMTKEWGLIPLILEGKKTIESRWYKTKRSPWNTIQNGDAVYFKNSGEPVTAVATVSHVQFIHPLDRKMISTVYEIYGTQIFPGYSDYSQFVDSKLDKNYCILVFLTDPSPVQPPFDIDKTGFGIGAAWITVDNISRIRKSCVQ